MRTSEIVIDTNVIVAALRSKRGASHRLLCLLGGSKFETSISVPLILEYEQACKEVEHELTLSAREVDDVIDYVCLVSKHRRVFYLWRPFLRDPKDDMVLELAVSAQCDFIVTFNIRDFSGIEQFGLKAVTPQEFLRILGEIP